LNSYEFRQINVLVFEAQCDGFFHIGHEFINRFALDVTAFQFRDFADENPIFILFD
tara:strand:+ start:3588 stop:3755 length:168 start_codon:yes stop_codon:yes gene_type:complete